MTPGRTLAKLLLIPTLALTMGGSDPVYSQTSGVKKNFSAQSAAKGAGKYLIVGETDSTLTYKQFLSEKLLTNAGRMSQPVVSIGYQDVGDGKYKELDYPINGDHVIITVPKYLVEGEQNFGEGLKEKDPKGAKAPHGSKGFVQFYNFFTFPKPGELRKLREKVKGLVKKVDEVDEGYDQFGKDLENLKKRLRQTRSDTTYEGEDFVPFSEDSTYEDEPWNPFEDEEYRPEDPFYQRRRLKLGLAGVSTGFYTDGKEKNVELGLDIQTSRNTFLGISGNYSFGTTEKDTISTSNTRDTDIVGPDTFSNRVDYRTLLGEKSSKFGAGVSFSQNLGRITLTGYGGAVLDVENSQELLKSVITRSRGGVVLDQDTLHSDGPRKSKKKVKLAFGGNVGVWLNHNFNLSAGVRKRGKNTIFGGRLIIRR